MQSPEPFLSKLQKQAGRQKHHRGEVRNPGLGVQTNILVAEGERLQEFAKKLIAEAWGCSTEQFLFEEEMVLASHSFDQEIKAHCWIAIRPEHVDLDDD